MWKSSALPQYCSVYHVIQNGGGPVGFFRQLFPFCLAANVARNWGIRSGATIVITLFGRTANKTDFDPRTMGGGGVWNNPAVDPDLGLVYFGSGNAVLQWGGELRAGDNLFNVSVIKDRQAALVLPTGTS